MLTGKGLLPFGFLFSLLFLFLFGALGGCLLDVFL